MNIIQNVVVSVLILAGGIAGLFVLGQKPEVPTQDVSMVDAAVDVVTAKVTEWNQPFQINVDGEAMAYRIVTVGAEVSGRIVSKSDVARSGSFVSQGTLLFEIDATNYRLDVDRLNAQLQQIDEQLNAIEVDTENTAELVKLAEEDWQLQQNQLVRMKELQVRKTANDSEVDAALKQELLARQSLQTLQNQERALLQQKKTQQAGRVLVETELARAEVDLSRCRVVSPLDGRIVDDAAEEGGYIKDGEVLVHISDSSRMEIKTKLRAEEVAWVWQQHAVNGTTGDELRNSADPIDLPQIPCEVAYQFQGAETIWDGYIARIEGTGIDRDTRTFPCRVLVEHPRETRFNDSGGRVAMSPPSLMSGMYVNVRIPVESPLQLLRLPMEAVRPGGYVWVKRDGKLDILEVTLANVKGEDALVRRDGSGLQKDDRVVVSPLRSVHEGMLLKESGEVVAPEIPDTSLPTTSDATAAETAQ